jgi:hypothetical protein
MTMASTSSLTKRIAKAALPTAGLSLLVLPALYVCFFFFRDDLHRVLARIVYTAVFAIGMEYVARFYHSALWHGPLSWFLHASHHHCVAKFGTAPSAKNTVNQQFVSASALEWNDIFPAIFATTAIGIMFWGIIMPPFYLFKDCAVGSAVGISMYGCSYFMGHDLCAHERGGKALAQSLRKWSPRMARCADLHVAHHHKIDKDAKEGEDPYGPPYGFWLGEQELQLCQEQERNPDKKIHIVPLWCQCMFTAAFGFMFYAAVVDTGSTQEGSLDFLLRSFS